MNNGEDCNGVLPICKEKFVVKDRLLKAAWIVGVVAIGALASVIGIIVTSQGKIDTKQDEKIETLERSIPSIDAKLNTLIDQGRERNRLIKLNKIRSGEEP